MVAARCAAKRAPAKARLPSARAACLARAPLRLTDTSGPAQTSETSQTARGLSAPVGGRALGLRSEGSWLAAELLRAGLEPGAVDRRAGWTGLCPSSPVPKVRPRPPARHAAASARAHIHPARPCAPWAILVPHCITTQSSCVPGFAQVSTRAFEQGAVRQWGTSFCVENGIGAKFSSGARPRTPGPLARYRVCRGGPQRSSMAPKCT